MIFVWLLPLAAGLLPGQPVCEPAPPVAAILQKADQPRDLRYSLADHRAAIHAIYDAAAKAHPDDPFLHAARLEFDLGRYGENRPTIAEDAEKRLAQQPANPHRLYFAALANYSLRTSRSIEQLTKLQQIHSNYGPALLLEARIRASKQFRDIPRLKAALAQFEKACPQSPALFPELAWIEDQPFLQSHIAKLRAQSIPAKSYPALWQMERVANRSDNMSAIHQTWQADVARLLQPSIPRNATWMNTLYTAAFLTEQPLEKLALGYLEDFAKHFPHAWPSPTLTIDKLRKLGPTPEAFEQWRALNKTYPSSTAIVSHWYSIARDAKDNPEAIVDAYHAMKAAMDLDPESFLTSPPYQISMAEDLVKRGLRLDLVPSFVIAGISAGERALSRESVTDLFPNAETGRRKMHDAWYLYGYYPLIEAYAVQKKFAEARDILSQSQRILDRMRPEPAASPEDKSRFAAFEAGFWRVKGKLAEQQGRKFDALISYRNALSSYGPRSARGDERDQVYAAAQQLAKELGATTEAWTDWDAKQPLTNVRSGHGGPNAWLQLAASKPGLRIPDMQGRTFTPAELAKTKTFVNVWATWCLPCRAELPYLEKLATRFKDRTDIAIIALNVDDDESIVAPFLKRFQFTFHPALARSYAYEFLPVFGVPANYLISDKTTYFEGKGQAEEWLESAAAALSN